MLPGIFLVRTTSGSGRGQGSILNAIGSHLVSINRFEEAFGDPQVHKDPKKADKRQRVVSLSNQATTKELRGVISTVTHWVKIAGKNGFNLMVDPGKTIVKESMKHIDAIIAYLDLHFADAGFVFDGDTNEANAPFTQLIKELVVRGRVVLCLGTQETENVELLGGDTGPRLVPRYKVWGDLVSHNFVDSWTTQMPPAQQTCAPCYQRPNFFYGLLDYLFAKETLTRHAVVGTVFMGSALPNFQMNPTTQRLTTGYTELVRLVSEPSKDGETFANFAHDLVASMPGLVVVVYHGVAGIGRLSPTVRVTGPMPRPLVPEDVAVDQRMRAVATRVARENAAPDLVAAQP